MKPFRVSRRRFLRGTGASGLSLALPPLDAMFDDRGRVFAAGAMTTPPPRFITYYLPQGVDFTDWHPKGGTKASWPTDWQLSPQQELLANFKSDINVVSGLIRAEAHWQPEPPFEQWGDIGHQRSAVTFATGAPGLSNGAWGPSVDWVAGQTLSKGLAKTSVSVRVMDSKFDPQALWGRTTSWTGRGAANEPYDKPSLLFQQLFGGPTAATDLDRMALYKKSALDYVKRDLNGLLPKLGKDDRARMDEYLTSLAEVERQLQPPSTSVACAKPTSPADAGDFPTRARLMIDLTVKVLECGITNCAAFMLGESYAHTGSHYDWVKGRPHIGDTIHQIAHRRKTDQSPLDLTYLQDTRAITKWEVGELAYLLGKLKSITEGPNTMLYNSLVFWAHEMDDGGEHSTSSCPVIICGNAGGAIKTGRRLIYGINKGEAGDPWSLNAPYSNIHVSMLNALGVPATKFGLQGKAPLAGFAG